MRSTAVIVSILLFVAATVRTPVSGANDDKAPDLIIINAKVHTLDPKDPEADAVAIRDGRFIAVGSNRKIRGLASSKTRLIDAEGRLILPGFNDSHTHLEGIGNLFGSADLRSARSAGDFRAEIARITEFLPKGSWVLGGRWDPTLADSSAPPSKEWIDAASPDHPVLLYSNDPSIALVNSEALKLARIVKGTNGPGGGEIVKNEDGEPTGILRGTSIQLVRSFTRVSSFQERSIQIETAANYAVAHGITSLQDVSTDDNMDVLTELERGGRLKARVYECGGLKDWEVYARQGLKAATGTPMVRTGCLKTFTDGNPDTIPDLYERIAGADKAGLQVAIHAIGSRSNRYVLSLYERAIKENGFRDRRFRVEHAQSLSPSDIPLFAKLGVIPSMQPYLFRGSGPYRSLLKTGAKIAFGSDSSITNIDPLVGISVATERNPGPQSEKLTVEEAVRLYTMGAAYAEFQENEKGSITAGKLADLVILSDDIFEMDPADIRNVRVLTTIVGGRVVYRAPR